MRRLSTLVLLLALPAAAALAAPLDSPRSVDLDFDGAKETIFTRCSTFDGKQTPCRVGDFGMQRRIMLRSSCRGRNVDRAISTRNDFVVQLQVRELDAFPGPAQDPRKEVFFEMRSGASGGGVDSRVVRYNGPCRTVRYLWTYPSRLTVGKPPRRGFSVSSTGTPRLANFDRRHEGIEIRLDQFYGGPNDPRCCPVLRRRSYFRYQASVDRYVRYSSRVSTLPAR